MSDAFRVFTPLAFNRCLGCPFSLIHPRNSSGRPLYHPVALQKKEDVKMFLRFRILFCFPAVFHDHREEVEGFYTGSPSLAAMMIRK